MVELEYNGECYMVDGGQWFRRLKERGIRPDGYQTMWKDHIHSERVWANGEIKGGYIGEGDWENLHYRVPCTDPRPPFVVGQRVKVARRSGDAYLDQLFGQCGVVSGIDAAGEVDCDFDNEDSRIDVHVSLPPWCLDPVEPATWIQRMNGYAPPADCESAPCGVLACNPDHREPDIDPELDHILKKLKPLTDRAADVRRIKRECYQKLAALLPEEKR